MIVNMNNFDLFFKESNEVKDKVIESDVLNTFENICDYQFYKKRQ